jgi:hypothetical protein
VEGRARGVRGRPAVSLESAAVVERARIFKGRDDALLLEFASASSTSRPGRRPSRTRGTRVAPIEHFSKQQLDLSHGQAFADQMTIDLKPKQAAGIT